MISSSHNPICAIWYFNFNVNLLKIATLPDIYFFKTFKYGKRCDNCKEAIVLVFKLFI
jgi:hypothetical protein